MIFMSKNEKGIVKWKQVLDETATVTRRDKPEPVGAVRAVQPGRGKKSKGAIRIKSCIPHKDWLRSLHCENAVQVAEAMAAEATKEGFLSWAGLKAWFTDHKTDMLSKYRIEFELIGKDA